MVFNIQLPRLKRADSLGIYFKNFSPLNRKIKLISIEFFSQKSLKTPLNVEVWTPECPWRPSSSLLNLKKWTNEEMPNLSIIGKKHLKAKVLRIIPRTKLVQIILAIRKNHLKTQVVRRNLFYGEKGKRTIIPREKRSENY